MILQAAGSQPAGGAAPAPVTWYSIGQVRGIDPSRAQQLHQMGIGTTADLLRQTQTPQARKALAQKLGVPNSALMLWIGDVISREAPKVAQSRNIDVQDIVDLEELDVLIEETETYDEEYVEMEIEEEEIVYELEEEEDDEEEEEEEEEEE